MKSYLIIANIILLSILFQSTMNQTACQVGGCPYGNCYGTTCSDCGPGLQVMTVYGDLGCNPCNITNCNQCNNINVCAYCDDSYQLQNNACVPNTTNNTTNLENFGNVDTNSPNQRINITYIIVIVIGAMSVIGIAVVIGYYQVMKKRRNIKLQEQVKNAQLSSSGVRKQFFIEQTFTK